ncbi:site-specific integrase [Yoonia sp.]|nr:site-specific integrase [Yoonia sp.]
MELKKNTYYYRRRVPIDVRSLYKNLGKGSVEQLYFSLKTTDKAEAARRADTKTRSLDALWRAHREGNHTAADPQVALAVLEAADLSPGEGIRHPDNPFLSVFTDMLIGTHEPHQPPPRVSPQDKLTLDILYGAPVPKLLTDAKDKHFELGKGPKGKVATDQFERAWKLLLEITGDISLDHLKRDHGNEFVRRLVAKGVGPETVKRYLSPVRPVIRTGILEFELNRANPLDSLVIPNANEGKRKPRVPFSNDELGAVQAACRQVDDERRWVIAMLSDSMARLAEIVGLKKQDLYLDAEVPHIRIQPNELRRLKTAQSERLVPLVGEALWAAKQATRSSGEFLFPSLVPKSLEAEFTAGAASAALNKWLKNNSLARPGQTLHSFRHTMRDRLRNAEAAPDLIDRIGGWAGNGVGESYGQGHSLNVMHRYMLKTVRDLEKEESHGDREVT